MTMVKLNILCLNVVLSDQLLAAGCETPVLSGVVGSPKTWKSVSILPRSVYIIILLSEI